MKIQNTLVEFKLFKKRVNDTNLYSFILAFLVFTIPYDTNYSNISLITIGVFFIAFFSFTNFKNALKDKSWQILTLNTLVFLLGLFYITNPGSNPNFDTLGKYVLLAALPVILYPKVEQYGQKIVLLSFCFGIILGLLWCFLQYYFFQNNIQSTYTNFTVPMGAIHPPYLSQFVVMAFFILLEFFFKLKQVKYKLLVVVILLFLFFFLVYLQARMPLFTFFICLVLYIIFKTYNDKTGKYFIFGTLITLVGAILFFGIINADNLFLIKARFVENLNSALSVRFNSWSCAWQIFIDNSKIFGVGFSNTQTLLDGCYKSNYLARPYFEHYNTHNQYLQILITSGVIGLSIWLVTLVYALRKVIKNQNVLGFIFLVLFMICCITEVYLARIWGILYFSVFYTLFVIKNYKVL